VTWWKRTEQGPTESNSVSELRRQLAETQSDVTVLFDQLERINNRLKQRASRATRSESDDSGDRSSGDDGGQLRGTNPAPMGDASSSSSLTESISDPAPGLFTKAQVQDLWRRQHHG
jgi:hypothetical protein